MEIRQSMGRYLAILAIVALGVSLFTGLKATQPFMVDTAEKYFAEKNFYDFQLLSTYGFEAEDVEYLRSLPGSSAVQGSYTYDVLCEYADTDVVQVMKVHSLTENVNGLEVVCGRLPESASECVVDSRLYGEESIGNSIRLTGDNEEDTLEAFGQQEFTIVGVVKASTYIQMERGNTSLGSGTVAGFAYVCPEAFDSDIYTEIYVKLNQNFPLYSEEYDDYIEDKESEWEAWLETAAQNRFDRIVAEAEAELADAKAEFATEKADAEAELADAKAELADAEAEIADGKQEIADAKKEIADGYAEIAEKEQELADGEAELLENEQTLLEKEQELLDGIEEWNDNNEIVEDSKKQINEAMEQINAQEQELLAGEAQLLEQEQQFEAMLPYLGNTMTQEEIDAARAQFAAGKAEIEAGKAQIAGYKAQMQDGLNQLADADRELAAAWMDIQDGQKQIAEGKQEIADAKAEIAEGKVKIADAKQELADAEAELADAEEELLEGEAEYLDGLQEYEEGLAEFRTEIADAEAEIADAEKDIAELEEPECFILGRDTNVGYVCFESDSGIVEAVSDVFPVFFFMVAALVCMTTMNRMIEEQRTQIGVLKALGYSNTAIMAKYLIYSGSAAFIGCVGGFFLGTIMFPKVIWTAYGMMYDMVPLVYYVDWIMALIAVGVSLLCSMGVTWYSCRAELGEVAASLMRPKTPKAGKRVFLEYIPFIWKRLKFLQKVSVRNVLRYKKRFFMMVIGISGCTALLVAAFGILDSVKGVVGMQYGEIQVYDMSVTFSEEPDEAVMTEFESTLTGKVNDVAMFMETSVDIQYNDLTKSVSLIVPRQPETIEDYIHLHTLKQEQISFPGKGEVVVTHKLAENLGVSVGDSVTLVDEDYRHFAVTVSGISRNFVSNYIFLHPDTCGELWKAPEYKAAYINVSDEGQDLHSFAAELMHVEDIVNVTINADVRDRFESMMSSMNYIVGIIILCAGALAFIVLYNLTNINITERIREIATIKVLGFYKKETSVYVFRENLILTAIGAVAGLFVGKVFHAFIMTCINLDMVAFDEHVAGTSYVYSILLTFLFAALVNCFMTGKIERISMTESLKSVD